MTKLTNDLVIDVLSGRYKNRVIVKFKKKPEVKEEMTEDAPLRFDI